MKDRGQFACECGRSFSSADELDDHRETCEAVDLESDEEMDEEDALSEEEEETLR